MKYEVRLYNVILPIWLILWIPSWLWLLVIPGNLAVDCLVCFLALLALKHTQKKAVLRRVWWKLWLLGFAADFVGAAWLFLGIFGFSWLLAGHEGTALYTLWEDTMLAALHDPFQNAAAFLWVLAGVALSGACIYFWDRRVLRKCPELDGRQCCIVALALAAATAPWLYFIPAY